MFSTENKESASRSISVNRALLMSCAGAWLIVAAAALIATGSTRMTAPEKALDLSRQIALWSAPAIILPLLICRVALRQMWSKTLGYVLAALAALTCLGVAVNIAGWCPDFDVASPDFGGMHTDQEREWTVACAIKYGTPLNFTPNNGYPLLINFIWRIFGHSILPVALFSAFCTVLAAGVTAATAARLLPHLQATKSAVCAAALFAIVPSIAWYGSICMKEAPVILAMSLCTYTLASIWRGQLSLSSLASIALGGMMLLLLKSPLGWWLMLGACAAATHALLSQKKGRREGSLGGALCVMLVAAAVVAGGREFRSKPDSLLFQTQAHTTPRVESLDSAMLGYSTVRPYAKILGSYYTLPIAGRIARLPFTATAQYFPPFPWNFNRDAAIGRFVPWAHMPLWYPVGGCVLGFIVLCLGRRNRAASMGLWAAWVGACWCGVALVAAGSVARYWLPLLPAMIPMAVQFLACAHSGTISRRSFAIYSFSYLLLLIIALLAAYISLNP